MKTAHIVTDLSFGDAGKGTTVDHLVRQAESAVVIRHSGGSQAAHNVVTPDGRHHTFAQFGSGSFVPGTKTHLSRYMLIKPEAMLMEAQKLVNNGVTDIWQRLTIDEQAPVILPWHRAANQLRELARGGGRHGSCGVGISEVMMDLLADPVAVIRAGDLKQPKALKARLRSLQLAKAKQFAQHRSLEGELAAKAWTALTDESVVDQLIELYELWLKTGLRIVPGDMLQELADTHEAFVFEGSQGVLLDEWYGFHPYTTWSTTTSENALKLLSEITHSATVSRVGVLRAYTTRHGPGPLITEDPKLAESIPELHNGLGTWMGAFRYGHFDVLAHRYAIAATGGVDELAVTGLDRSDRWHYATAYNVPYAEDVEDYFTLDARGKAVAIRLGVQGDLDYQGRLTELLMACSPLYRQPAPVDSTGLLRMVEDAYSVPVTIASYGPSAADKRVPSLV